MPDLHHVPDLVTVSIPASADEVHCPPASGLDGPAAAAGVWVMRPSLFADAARAAVRRLPSPARRVVRALGHRLPVPRRPTAPDDPFARYRRLDGPALFQVPAFAQSDGTAPPRLVVLLPHLETPRLTGGPNTALNLAGRMAAAGIAVRCLAVWGLVDPDLSALHAHVEMLAGTTLAPGSIEFDAAGVGAVPVGRDDVFLATWWQTAYVAQRALELTRAREFVYLVQDFEPSFYPWSTMHAMALATYGMPCRAIVNQATLRDHLVGIGAGIFGRADAADRSIVFEPAVDRGLFAPPPSAPPAGRRLRLVFYARPKNERNLFDLGLLALRAAAARGALDPERWECRSMGHELPDLPLSAGLDLVNAPRMAYSAYARFLAGSDVLLSPMLSPHTSYPPLEMAASGGRVVTTAFGPKTAEALTRISPLIRGVAPDRDALASAIVDACRSVETGTLHRQSELTMPATWEEALRDVVPWLTKVVADLRAKAPTGRQITVDGSCPICGDAGPSTVHRAREMMFATREPFDYLECSACGTLRIATVPADLDRHYPPAYHARTSVVDWDDGPLRRWLSRERARPLILGQGWTRARLIGRLDRHGRIPGDAAELLPMLRAARIRDFDDPVVDVGCGRRPSRLVALRRLGFTDLLGVDAYIDRDLVDRGVSVRRATVASVPGAGRWALVMLHHVFEHLTDPRATLAAVIRLLRPGGTCLIRTPLADGEPWRRYRTDWYELDPPRHLFVFSRRALIQLAREAGFIVGYEIADSTELDLIISEQYRRDIGLYEPDSWLIDRERSGVDPATRAAYAAEARRMNETKTAGRGGFYLHKPGA
jgi:SAM-dependent methyltransferase